MTKRVCLSRHARVCHVSDLDRVIEKRSSLVQLSQPQHCNETGEFWFGQQFREYVGDVILGWC